MGNEERSDCNDVAATVLLFLIIVMETSAVAAEKVRRIDAMFILRKLCCACRRVAVVVVDIFFVYEGLPHFACVENWKKNPGTNRASKEDAAK